MKKLLLILLLFLFSCSTKVLYVPEANQYIYSQEQFDSLCTVDNLSPNLTDWLKIDSRGYESKIKYTRYFITRGDSVTYKVDYINNSYHCEILKFK